MVQSIMIQVSCKFLLILLKNRQSSNHSLTSDALQIQYKTSSKLMTNELHTSSCHYHVTGLVPIVRGQFPRYEKHAPPGSYINADAFFSAQDLANYLHYLIENPVEYMKYFQWKRYI